MNANPPADEGKYGKDNERPQHHPRTLMRIAVAMLVSVWRGRPRPRVVTIMRAGPTIVAEEGHEPQPEHVERSYKCCDDADQPIHPAPLRAGISHPQNLVLREESGKGREPGDCECRNRHRQKRPGHVNPQPAHLAHVLLATDAVNYRTSRKEQ